LGVFLAAPSLKGIIRRRKFAAGALAVLATFPLTLLVASAAYGLVSGRAPGWPLLAMGAAGALLVAMAARDLRRGVGGTVPGPAA
jgi:hypothetical protein